MIRANMADPEEFDLVMKYATTNDRRYLDELHVLQRKRYARPVSDELPEHYRRIEL